MNRYIEEMIDLVIDGHDPVQVLNEVWKPKQTGIARITKHIPYTKAWNYMTDKQIHHYAGVNAAKTRKIRAGGK